MRTTVSVLLILTLAACKKEPTAPPAAEQARPAPPAQPAGKAATPAASPTGAGEKTPAPPANPMEALAQLAKAGEALSKQGGQQPLGPVVSWRDLQAFVPAKLGGFEAEGELDGSTGGMGAMTVSTVKRRYKSGSSSLRLEIVDSSMAPMMRAGFAMAAHIQEDSTRGIKKGVTVEGQQGILEWRKAGQRGELTLLVGGRYVVTLKLHPTDDPEAVVKLAQQIDLQKLAALQPKK